MPGKDKVLVNYISGYTMSVYQICVDPFRTVNSDSYFKIFKLIKKPFFPIQSETGKLRSRNLSLEDINVINQRNAELVAQLRNIDSAFSLGESGNGEFAADVKKSLAK